MATDENSRGSLPIGDKDSDMTPQQVEPLYVYADPSARRPVACTQQFIRIPRTHEGNQEAILFKLCSSNFTSKVVVFSGTRFAAHRLSILFGLIGLKATELHRNLTQAQRLEVFRNQEVDYLIATDVAARGVDIIGVQTVINFDCPRNLTSYIHRLGRLTRAGQEGYVVTFLTDNSRGLRGAIVKRQIGSNLMSRGVVEQSVSRWSQKIEQLEDQVRSILQEERREEMTREAEMEAELSSEICNLSLRHS